uniref:Rap GTPase interactor n=1 Tax=Esox lucius TaxID=8010 RepID=A0AAY5L5C1_ESOLU
MFYGSSGASMSLPSKSRLKRQSRTFTQVLYRTLSYRDRPLADHTSRDRRSITEPPDHHPHDDPAELSTQSSAPGVLKIFGDEICEGANYKSVLATPRSSAQELVKEALERYSLNKAAAHSYVLCDVIGRLEGDGGWRTECLRAMGDNEKPLLLQELWKPREGHARRFELRRRVEVEELNAKEKDTVTADINAQARKLQRNRAKGTLTLPRPGTTFSRSLSETSLNQDCLVYLNSLMEQHTVGQETPSARPNICLSSPDILPLHCRLHRVPATRRHCNAPNNSTAGVNGDERFCVAVEPVPHATVLVNFSRCERSTQLRHGDLLSFGSHYIFLYKDPTGARPLPAQTLARAPACKLCGSVLRDKGALSSQTGPPARRSFKPHLVKPRGVGDALVSRIMSLIEPGGDDHKLTPAYLLCLSIQHSASAFPPGCFGTLLLKIVRRIQALSWEKTKELAQKQAHQDPASLSLLSISDLIPDLQVIFFWMANSIEILYFIQQKAPSYTQGIETLDSKGSKESLLSATISANEEAMTILEEVIMYTFQQCVYYITKSLYVVLPGLLDCNPFPVDSSEPCWRGGTGFPEPIRRVLQVFQCSQELLQGYQVHMEVQAQMFAYLFFFTNVSLFNQLMDKGPLRGWFQRSKILQVQACLRMVLEWARKAGLSHLADKFFSKFNSAVSILATPPQILTQMSWKVLCMEHPSLKPVQLHRLLTQYQQTAEMGPVPIWQPSTEDEPYIYRTVDLLESFENHPPIVLPSGGFRVDLDSDCVEDSIYRQLLYIRHFLWGLRTKTHTHPTANNTHTHTHPTANNTHTHTHPTANNTHTHTHPTGECPTSLSSPRSGGGELVEERGRDGPLDQSHSSMRRNGTAHHPWPPNQDPSCLLTPPNTPLYPEVTPQVNGNSRAPTEGKKSNGIMANGLEGSVSEFPLPVSLGPLSRDDDCCGLVFIVELDKGPYGLGMGLIDGLHTPLNAAGIYIRTLIPEGPAASDGRLRIGDRILAVNGTSLIGADYQSAVDLIRLGGGRLRFLVAKSDLEVTEKISASSC